MLPAVHEWPFQQDALIMKKTEYTLVGFDPSLSNWGVAVFLLDIETMRAKVTQLDVIKSERIQGKHQTASSADLIRTTGLAKAVLEYVKEADFIFTEMPIGSQSAAAMRGYGTVLGILGTLSVNHHLFEVMPSQVKGVTGDPTASKKEMIEWAHRAHPEAPWPTQVVKGQTKLVADKAEHMADAIATVYAGVRTPVFKMMLDTIKAK